MGEVNEALQRICSALNSTDKIETSIDDWRIIFDHCEGSDYIETVNNLQNFIADNFSFEIKGTEGLVYFGSVDDSNKIPVYKVMDAYSNHYPEYYGYISSTQAGKLFNDEGFNEVLCEWSINTFHDEKIGGFIDMPNYHDLSYKGRIIRMEIVNKSSGTIADGIYMAWEIKRIYIPQSIWEERDKIL